MPVKRIIHPTTGQTLCFGRDRPKTKPRFRLRDYLPAPLPQAPPTCDYTAQAAAALAQMYLNATYGCCVPAGQFHLEGVFTGNANPPAFIATDAQVESLYTVEGGFDPSQTQPDGSNPTDNGCDEMTALTNWQSNGLLGNGTQKIAGILNVDPTNVAEIQAAAYLFFGLMYGVELPDDWINPFPSTPGFVWDVADDPDPDNGHCFIGAGYDGNGVTICTWGMLGSITYAAMAEYCSAENNGALYAVLSQDIINAAQELAPNGLDWAQLQADFDSQVA
jgi:hypothetical protein